MRGPGARFAAAGARRPAKGLLLPAVVTSRRDRHLRDHVAAGLHRHCHLVREEHEDTDNRRAKQDEQAGHADTLPRPRCGRLNRTLPTPNSQSLTPNLQPSKALRSKSNLGVGSWRLGVVHRIRRSNAAISARLRTRRMPPSRAGWFQVFPSSTGNRTSSSCLAGFALTSASSPSSDSTIR